MKLNKALPRVENIFTTRRLRISALFCATIFLSACSGGSGQDTETQPDTTENNGGATYSGPGPETDDVNQYKRYIWDNLAAQNRCGSCHIENNQSPHFVRGDDINAAYDAGRDLVNLSAPDESRLVTKVGGGHNCWLSSADACSEIITNYIEEWARASGSLSNTISLTAPIERDVGASKSFPENSGSFGSTVYPLLRNYCADCHSEDAATAQQPFFASADVDLAYELAVSKINLDSPADSRFSVRLGNEFHNCWDDCSSNEDDMTTAIQAFADTISLTQVDSDWVISKALRLTDGIVASSGGRIENNAIALYEFKTGSGTTAFDTSGVNPAVDLALSGDVEWIDSWGLQLKGGKAQGATATSRKLYDTLTATGEYSIEIWAAPANVSQDGPARIVTYSGGDDIRNLTLGQDQYSYTFQNRSDSTDADGMPVLATDDADQVVQASLQHVIATYDPINGRKLYVNGADTGEMDPAEAGLLNTWDDTFALAVGSEVSNGNSWEGSIRLLAIHSRALSAEDVATNYDVGVGEKYLLLFNVEEHTGIAESYVMLTVQQFDNYAYLFSEPTFINLDDSVDPSGIAIEGMRIGINGREAEVGQAWAKLSTAVDDSYLAGEGQQFSRLGTIITLENGPTHAQAPDEFFLTFERIGNASYARMEETPAAPAEASDLEPQSRIGLRRFEQINASLSQATGISIAHPDIWETWDTVKRQLPVSSDIEGFLAAQQMGITQLAVKYCSTLVDSNERNSFFNGFDFTASADSAFDSASKRSLIIDPLMESLVGHEMTWHDGSVSQLASAPELSTVETELDLLIDTMTACGGSCAADRTETTVKAVCAAAMGSAMILIH
ncbi:LamG domain-containing protein [Microbulbifer sp. OS29]|uniref:LamG domain-containing protein n=1 Tax=Microbulbifer okhotskensis TaxID=2926617 RepID=A0A9X2EJD9_9GAMM|nr:LamG domain-containing protein [Microbulbifer okhotskensis]MCO1332769.1 LamG domain-containing protein [Microbulbifer okhotskensis]